MRGIFKGALLLLAGCTGREPVEPGDWNANLPESPATKESTTEQASGEAFATEPDLSLFAEQLVMLDRMQRVERAEGEVLLTAGRMLFDRAERTIRMEQDVLVVEDGSILEAGRLTGCLSAENRLERADAKGKVLLRRGGREARSDQVRFDHVLGTVELSGRAVITEANQRLSGERIRVELHGAGALRCEPNARLEVKRLTGGAGWTEVRAREVRVDGAARAAEFFGNVRMRDARGSLDCDRLQIHMKKTGDLGWMKAHGRVTMQAGEVRASAGGARYDPDAGMALLTAAPQVIHGHIVLSAEVIRFWPLEERVVGEPSARARWRKKGNG